MTMEVRTHANISPYVATTARKVAETPIAEGEYADAYKTYGPFNGESMKGNNYVDNKAEEDSPIDKALDSILIFFDDVREASETQRARCGELSIAESTAGLNGTLERFTEGICKNPCMEDCSRIQPPADLMLSVENKKEEKQLAAPPLDTVYEEQEDSREPVSEGDTKQQRQQQTAKKVRDYSFSKENSVKDMSAPEAEEGREAPQDSEGEDWDTTVVHQDTVQMFKDTILSVVPDQYKAQLRGQLDFYLPNEGVLGVEAPVELPVGEYPVDEDPVVEAIDRLILMFDELKDTMLENQIALMKGMEDRKLELLQKAAELTNAARAASAKAIAASPATPGKSIADKSDATTASATSEETVKTMNKKTDPPKNTVPPKKSVTPKKKPASWDMKPDEYSEAVMAAASVLAETAPEEDREKYSVDELHQRALERIMSERSEMEDEYASGEAEYKTEQEILSELLKEADQAIMDTRSADDKETEERYRPPSHCPTDELAVLETSVTLTPIPEADEETSADTPALSEKIEGAMEARSIPVVPMAAGTESKTAKSSGPADLAVSQPNNQKKVESEVDNETKDDDVIEPQEEQYMDAEENDPIIRVIDSMFLCYDDVQEQDVVTRGCAGCIGDKPTDSDVTELKEMMTDDAIQALTDPIDPEPRNQETAQHPAEETIDGKDYTSPIDLTTEPTEELSAEQEETAPTKEDPVVNAIDDLMKAFDETKEQEEALQSLTEKLNSLKDYIINGSSKTREGQEITDMVNAAYKKHELRSRPETKESQENPAAGSSRGRGNVEFEFPDYLKQDQDPYIAWGGDDSELMASINADRKLSELEHENIFRDVSKGNKDMFPIYNAPAFTEGNSSSRSNSNEDERAEQSTEAGVKLLSKGSWTKLSNGSWSKAQTIVTTNINGSSPRSTKPFPEKMKATNNGFQGWSLPKKREQMVKDQIEIARSF